MQLIVISPEEFWPDEKETLLGLFERGLKYYHLRKPTSTYEEVKAFVESIPKEYHERIVVHYYLGCVTNFGLMGLHYNSKNLDQAVHFHEGIQEVSKLQHGLKKDNTRLNASYSAHSYQEVLSVQETFTYQFLSPVFDSISKVGYTASFQLDEMKTFLTTHHNLDIVALGGVKAERLPLLQEMGFWGAAVLGEIWNKQLSPAERIQKFDVLCQQL